jgi:hypothetical protein
MGPLYRDDPALAGRSRNLVYNGYSSFFTVYKQYLELLDRWVMFYEAVKPEASRRSCSRQASTTHRQHFD